MHVSIVRWGVGGGVVSYPDPSIRNDVILYAIIIVTYI